MNTPATTQKLNGLARRLVEERVLAKNKALEAQASAASTGTPLINVLVESGFATPVQVANAASAEFGVPLLDLAVFDRELIPSEYLNEELIQKYHALPIFKRSNRLYIAISDPMNLLALDEFKFSTGIPTEPILVEDNKLSELITTSLEASDSMTAWQELDLEEDLDNISVKEEESNDNLIKTGDFDETPVVRFVNKMMLDAIRQSASDIHLETYEKQFRVRFRIDGILSEIANPPLNLAPKIIARVKVMSRMDISERRIPQDGRIKIQISKKKGMDFRVNSCPTLYGEKIVLRLLDPSSATLGIDALGYDDQQKKLYLNALSKPYGMILVTGPTGSGKTVSLYTGLNILNTPDRNISTAEDPAEINMPGVNQVNVNAKVGLDFSNALRAFLRQDPDVIMVGEIRDLETAEIAIKAAQTGHLVLSTLHTNDAPQTLTRLMNMGVPAFNIASSVSLIIAQRLARRLCPHCKAPDDIPREALLEEGFTEADLNDIKIYKAVGCNRCTKGYKGRLGIFQVMPISDAMGRLIMEGGNALQIADQSKKEGIPDLRESGLRQAKEGLTSLEEINRVTKD